MYLILVKCRTSYSKFSNPQQIHLFTLLNQLWSDILNFVLKGALLEDNVYTIDADFGDGTTLTTQTCKVVKP